MSHLNNVMWLSFVCLVTRAKRSGSQTRPFLMLNIKMSICYSHILTISMTVFIPSVHFKQICSLIVVQPDVDVQNLDAPLKLLKERQSANDSPSMRLLQYDTDIKEKRQKMCNMAKKKLNEVIIPWQLGIFNKQSHIIHSQCYIDSLLPCIILHNDSIYARIFTGQ